MRIEEVNYMNMIDWCLTPTLAVFQLYRGELYEHEKKLHSSNNKVKKHCY